MFEEKSRHVFSKLHVILLVVLGLILVWYIATAVLYFQHNAKARTNISQIFVQQTKKAHIH